jgi:hypothetical protein
MIPPIFKQNEPKIRENRFAQVTARHPNATQR